MRTGGYHFEFALPEPSSFLWAACTSSSAPAARATAADWVLPHYPTALVFPSGRPQSLLRTKQGGFSVSLSVPVSIGRSVACLFAFAVEERIRECISRHCGGGASLSLRLQSCRLSIVDSYPLISSLSCCSVAAGAACYRFCPLLISWAQRVFPVPLFVLCRLC